MRRTRAGVGQVQQPELERHLQLVHAIRTFWQDKDSGWACRISGVSKLAVEGAFEPVTPERTQFRPSAMQFFVPLNTR